MLNKMSFGGNNFVIPSKSGSYIGLKQIDLTGITSIEFNGDGTKSTIECRRWYN